MPAPPRSPAPRSPAQQSAAASSRRYGVSTETIRKWRKLGTADCRDHSARPHRLSWKATEEERSIVCALRQATNSRRDHLIAPNRLARNFTTNMPDHVWLADITDIATDDGWLDLVAIKDVATREMVRWSMTDHVRAGLCSTSLLFRYLYKTPIEARMAMEGIAMLAA